jgi:hypothetical protein
MSEKKLKKYSSSYKNHTSIAFYSVTLPIRWKKAKIIPLTKQGGKVKTYKKFKMGYSPIYKW